MSYKRHFFKIIEKRYPENHRSILADIDRRYEEISSNTEFSFTSGNPLDKRLDFSGYFLALIQVMDRRGEGYEHIKETCLQVAYEYVKPKNRIQHWFKKVPGKLTNTILSRLILKWLDRKISTKGHEDGFEARIIFDKRETYGLGYGVDILECGVCKLFVKYDYQKYVSILCEVDKMTSGLAGLELIRSGTIATGADKCDFRFRKRLV